jgi:hypothetical protein
MLPTLINPDLGGGNVGDTGGTLLMIGNYLRKHSVAAMIFPSARCDTAAAFDQGGLAHFQGWNLVDLRAAPPLGKARLTNFGAQPMGVDKPPRWSTAHGGFGCVSL